MNAIIDIPDDARDLVEEADIVLHARELDGQEVRLAICAIGSRQWSKTVLFTTDPHLVQESLRRMGVRFKVKKVDAETQELTTGFGTICVCGDTDEPDVPSDSAVVVMSANAIGKRPPALLGRMRSLIFTEPVPEQHWAREEMEKPGMVLASLTGERANNLLRTGTAGGDDELVYVAVPRVRTPFRVFARKRLFVRTEKPAEALTDVQRETAHTQLGEGYAARGETPIVPLYLSSLQHRYQAMKRLGRAKGFRKFVVVKFRRGGITTMEQGESYGRCCDVPHTHAITIGDTMVKSNKVFGITRLMWDRDPQRPRLLRDPSESRLMFASGSVYQTATAGGRAVGRGESIQRVHGHEVPYWMQGPRQVDEQRRYIAGLAEACPHGEIVWEGTPQGREYLYLLFNGAREGSNDYYPIFLRWFDDARNSATPGTFNATELAETLTSEESDLVERYGLSMAQIAFRRDKKRSLKRLFDQEYPEDPESCFLTSGTCFFDKAALIARRKCMPDYERKSLRGGYRVTWEQPEADAEYVIGVDTSEGVPGGDSNGAGVLRKDTGVQVASIHGLWRPGELAQHVVALSKEYNGALVGIERNNHGHAVLMRVKQLGLTRSHRKGGSLYYAPDKREGWLTSPTTRPQMLDALADRIEEADSGSLDWLRDQQLVTECLTFNRQTTGKWEADSGCHDDSVMKWAIAEMMRRERKRRVSVVTVGAQL